MIKLIATDMDGTFLDDRGGFDRVRFETILDQLEARSIPFVVASGNHMSRLLAMFEGFEDRVVFVADNGAHLYQQGRSLHRHCFTSDLVKRVLEFYGDQQAAVCLMLANDEQIYMAEGAGYPFDESLAIDPVQLETFKSKLVWHEDLSLIAETEPIYKIGLWVPESQVEEVVDTFNQAFPTQLRAVTSGYGSIDILPWGVDKATGLARFMEPLGILPEEILAFGDSDNDLELLAYAGQAYAMENASDKVKAAANHIAPHHAKSGVLSVIESYLK